MSDSEKKYATFRDLRNAKPPLVHPSPPEPPQATQAPLSPPKRETPAPARDFNRRANSLERDALPAGLFPGSSKKLYDAMYLRTRGAVVPVKTIRATRKELGKWAGIKNIKTIAAHLTHLTTIGLLVHHWERGSTEGSTYEVRLPEEAGIGLGWPKPTLAALSPPDPTLDQKTGQPLDQISGSGGLSQTADSQRTSEDRKTSFKTKDRSDDDPLSNIETMAAEFVRELTGREATAKDLAALPRLVAAALDSARLAFPRTEGVTAPVAFAAAVVRSDAARGTKPRRGGSPEARERGTGAATEPGERGAAPPPEPPDADLLAEYERIRAELEGK